MFQLILWRYRGNFSWPARIGRVEHMYPRCHVFSGRNHEKVRHHLLHQPLVD
jgi:hypothetical protein